MLVRTSDDHREYAAAVGDFLRADAVTNTVALTVLAMLEAGGGYDDAPPWFAWAVDGDEVVGAAFRTPPYPVGLSGMTAPAARALGAACAGRELPGAMGRSGVVEEFAAGADRELTVRMRELQYVLHRLVEPPPVPGEARPIGDDDVDLFCEWMDAFIRETGVTGGDPRRSLENRRSTGGVLDFWWVDGTPVAFAGRSAPVGGVPRIGPVWTVPEHRRHGYAAAVTAHVCAGGLAAGATACTLFADEANPTSNAVYERLGFRPAGRLLDVTFSAR